MIGAVSSIGTVGNSFGNDLAETVNRNYKVELVEGPDCPGPGKPLKSKNQKNSVKHLGIRRRFSSPSRRQSSKRSCTLKNVRQKPRQKTQIWDVHAI